MIESENDEGISILVILVHSANVYCPKVFTLLGIFIDVNAVQPPNA